MSFVSLITSLILSFSAIELSGRWEMQLSNQVRLWRNRTIFPLFPLRWARSSLPLTRRSVRSKKPSIGGSSCTPGSAATDLTAKSFGWKYGDRLEETPSPQLPFGPLLSHPHSCVAATPWTKAVATPEESPELTAWRWPPAFKVGEFSSLERSVMYSSTCCTISRWSSAADSR